MADLKFKVAVSTGLFGIARGEELATVIRKTGYGLTRGTSAIEIAGDVPHEIDFTEGQEVRYIAKKQGIDLNFHGSLTIPFCIPEMVQFREAQDHVQKSLKSAVYGGCKYVDFHACLHFWLEMLTYVGARLEIIMCDWKGRFISEILFESEKLREYFIKHYWDKYDTLVLGEEMRPIWYEVEEQARRKVEEERAKRALTPEEIGKKSGELHADLMKKLVQAKLRERLSAKKPKDREWYYLGRERGDYVDACDFLAHFLFFTQDPVWVHMVKMYKDILDKYNYDPENDEWLRTAFKEAEDKGDEKFKEFYYGVIGAKFLQGHLMIACRWMAETKGEDWNYEKKGLPTIIEKELKMINPPNIEKEKKELLEILKNVNIAIEMPDARDPREAGRYMLWKTKQIYVAVKETREALKKEGNPYWDKIFMLIDFEHIATQGVDPFEELKDLTNNAPDAGRYVRCVHANYPSPLHSHFPIELGDDRIYRLLWILKEAGLGKDHVTYILFERGGFKDPFRQAVTALNLMVRFLKKNVPPDKLPDEFYAVYPRGLLSEERQWVTVFHHAMDPLKGTLKIPEEEYTFLGRAATEAGKRPEEWKKEEFR